MAQITFDIANSYGVTLDSSKLTATYSGSPENKIRATEGKTSGKWYFEFYCVDGGASMYGIVSETVVLTTKAYLFQEPQFRGYYLINGNKLPENTTYSSSGTVGQFIGVLLDLENGSLGFIKNGVFLGNSHTDLGTLNNPIYPCLTTGSLYVNSIIANFGATEFDLVTRNPVLWDSILGQGFKPYDVENSFMFSQKYLIKSQNKMYTLFEGNWLELGAITGEPVKTDFDNYGFEGINGVLDTRWAELVKPIEVYTWTDNVDATSLTLAYEEKEFLVPKLKLDVPEYRLIDELKARGSFKVITAKYI